MGKYSGESNLLKIIYKNFRYSSNRSWKRCATLKKRSKEVKGVAKKAIIVLLSVIVLLLIALTIFFYTDHRYSYAIKTYRSLSQVESMEVAYKSRIGLGENLMGIHGTAAMTFNPKASYIEVATDLPFLGSQKIMDIYTEGPEVYHKFNLSFLPWQKGIPLLSEDAFNPSNLTEMSPKAELLPVLKFMASLKKEEDETTLTYYTTDFFTNEEFKEFLVGTLKLEGMNTEDWNITAYKIAAYFDKKEKLMKEVSLAFTNEVQGIQVENEFSLEILSVNSLEKITAPEGLPRDE